MSDQTSDQLTGQPSTWAIGWSYFAALMLLVSGVFQSVMGLAALVQDDFYAVTREYVFSFDATTWGWIHLVLGVVLALAGIGIITGNLAARIVGVIVAGLSAVANFAFLPWYPVWSITVIAVDVAVIWALTAHGRDIQATA
jgi:hypothetical protein